MLRRLYLFCAVTVLLSILSSYAGAVNEVLLNQAGLKTVWQNTVSLEPKEEVQKFTVLGNYLYILTSSNYLFCFDRFSGRLSYADNLTSPRLPVFEPAECNGITYFIAANNILAIDVEKGVQVWQSKLPFSTAITAPAVNNCCMYIGGADKRLHIIDVNSRQENFRIDTGNASNVTSIVATDYLVIFATSKGNIVCMQPTSPIRLWQFDAVGSVTAPVILHDNDLYVSGRDTNLYRLNTKNGSLKWKFLSGSILTSPARVTNDTVYQYAKDKGLYAIDVNSGREIWLEASGLDLLSQSGNIAYVMGQKKVCIVMDNRTAKRIFTINFASVTNYAANTYDDKIYIIEDKNISCIEPVKK